MYVKWDFDASITKSHLHPLWLKENFISFYCKKLSIKGPYGFLLRCWQSTLYLKILYFELFYLHCIEECRENYVYSNVTYYLNNILKERKKVTPMWCKTCLVFHYHLNSAFSRPLLRLILCYPSFRNGCCKVFWLFTWNSATPIPTCSKSVLPV